MSILASEPLSGVSVTAGRLFGWWCGELRAACADAAALLRVIGRDPLTLEAGERRWKLRRKSGLIGEIEWPTDDADSGRRALLELAGNDRRPAPLVVEIPPERVLSKTIELPAAAGPNLDRILSFEIGRHFPFPAERVFYRHRVVRRSDGSGAAAGPVLWVELVAVPREVILSIADELAAVGRRASAYALLSAPSATPVMIRPLVAVPKALSRANRRRAFVVAVMALAAVISWPVAQHFRLAALEREIALLKPRAEAALRAQERQRREAEQGAAIAALGAGRPPLIAILDTLSREVPNDSWLTGLSINGRDIVLDGLSPSAASIALALGKTGEFRDIAYRSPITRDPTTGLERFQLGFAIGGKSP
jgi:general secretion pathway protein L